MDFYYGGNFFYALVKHRAFGFVDFIASIGGLIGLIAGVSLISLIEFVYFIAFKVCEKLTSRRRTTKVHPFNNNRTVNVNQDHVLYQFSKYFFEFMKETSIHGLVYTTDKKQKLIGRIFWAIIVLLSTIACGILIKDTIRRTELNPSSLVFDDKVWKVDEVKSGSLIVFT